MATMAIKIETLLKSQFPDADIKITDDSQKHAGHAGARPGGETHFTVQLVTAEFKGQSQLARHRAINNALQSLFNEGLHALAIVAKTPEEMEV